ncbi:MAG: sulfate ABC transporter permease subunit CysT [Actinobacteria bacterium]|nr:sulfate ABC transporter permease subunit CysT [Actinomycetota bacterium]
MEAGTVQAPSAPRAPRVGIRLPGVSAGLGRGIVVLYLSLLVLLPLAALAAKSVSLGLGHFWAQVTTPAAINALELTLVASLIVVIVNGFFGTVLAWILVRDEFPGKSIVNAVIDLPFALPTIVASLILIELWGKHSPLGIDISLSRTAVVVALMFVTLPFVVRAVQPLLMEMDREMEEAAASLGAGGFTIFRRVIFPNLLPGLAAGVALAFARALGEFGSVLLFAGGLADTQVSSIYIKQLIEQGNESGAAAVSMVLLAASLLVLLLVGLIQRWGSRHERSGGAGLTVMPMSGIEPQPEREEDERE